MERTATRRDFIHQMSATLAVVAATYRSVGPAEGVAASSVPGAGMTWTGDAFATGGELQVLRKFALAAAHSGARDEAFDHLLTAASLVDAPTPLYRETLAALWPLCNLTGRPQAATTIDWYLQRDTHPTDTFDAAHSRLARGEALAAAIEFERIGLVAHAAHALERAGCGHRARERYRAIANNAVGLPRALAVLGAARLSAPSAARDHAFDIAIAHARRSVGVGTRRACDVIEALDDRDFARSTWDPRTPRAKSDRFRFVAAPPWIEPMLDAEAPRVEQLCASQLLARSRFEQRVSTRAADFVLRRVMVTRLLALEVTAATGERRALLATSLGLRVGQLGDERFSSAPSAPVAIAAA